MRIALAILWAVAWCLIGSAATSAVMLFLLRLEVGLFGVTALTMMVLGITVLIGAMPAIVMLEGRDKL